MPQGQEQRIQQRAYEIWESEGCPSGQDQEHWLRAERETGGEEHVTGDSQAPEATVNSPGPNRPLDQTASQAVEAVEAVSGRRKNR